MLVISLFPYSFCSSEKQGFIGQNPGGVLLRTGDKAGLTLGTHFAGLRAEKQRWRWLEEAGGRGITSPFAPCEASCGRD